MIHGCTRQSQEVAFFVYLLALKRNKNRTQSCEKAWPPPIGGVSRTLTRASRLLRQKTATAAPLALSRN
jgi:hypothetical protein